MTVNPVADRLDHLGQPFPLGEDARLWLFEGVVGERADDLFHTLCNQLPWQQPRVTVFGAEHPVPRLTCWLAERGVDYRYSGLIHRGQGLPAALGELRDTLERLTGLTANGVLANLYRDGNDTMGWHRDNEPELGPAPWVLSYSLGTPRDFAFRRHGESRQHRVLTLPHDSLLVMSPRTQVHFEHALPRRRRITGARLNLTFRDIIRQKTNS